MQVRINDLVTCVAIALETEPVSTCSACEVDGNGMVVVNELVDAVNAALNGCNPPVGGTATPTATPIGGTQIPTATPTPPAQLSCPNGQGTGLDGLSWPNQTLAYHLSDAHAGANVTGEITWGVRYNNPALDSSAYTGSLRASLWALPFSFNGQTQFQGYRISTGLPNFTGPGARSSNQIYNFHTFANIQSSGAGTNPPEGSYCVVLFLDQYNSHDCVTSDHYCFVDWVQFDGPVLFP
jgi:hypothetical protein